MPTVSFAENELEDYLCKDNGAKLKENFGLRFVARQVQIDTGIVDILAVDIATKTWVIIELKRGNIDVSAYFQAKRYLHFYKMNHPCRADCCERQFAILLIGHTFSPDLNYTLSFKRSHFYDGEFYNCFGWSFEKGLSFHWSSPQQQKIQEGDYA